MVLEPIRDRYMALGWNTHVPPYVRQGMFGRAVDNDDLLPTIRKPVLITHSDAETIVKPAAALQHLAAMPHARAHWTHDVGHAPFWDRADDFNQQLREFATQAVRMERAGRIA